MATKQSKKRDEENEMSDEEMMEEVIDEYKIARKIGMKLFGTVTLTQARELYGLMDDDVEEEEFEDELRECQEQLIGMDAGPVSFDDVVGLYVDVYLGDE